MKTKRIQISYLLRPHWKTLIVAFIAVIGESAADLLEPWPLKVVFDYVLGSKKMPGWLDGIVNSVARRDRLAILDFAAFSVIPIAAVVYIYTRRIKKASRAVRQKEGEVVSIVQEVLSSIRVVKAFAREDYEQSRFEHQSLESVETALRARSLKAKLAPIVQIIVAVGTCLVLWYGVKLVLAGKITAGSLLVFFLYLGKMYKPMRELSKMTDTLSKTAVGYERGKEVIETEREIRNVKGARPAPPLK